MDNSSIWFPEPAGQDDTPCCQDELTIDWLRRSTWVRAKEVRRFLNFNISQIPATWQPEIYKSFLTRDWDSVFLELFVGRTLQLLRAAITVEEPIEATGKRPDFVATFPDGSVTVEATTIMTNKLMCQQTAENDALMQVVKALLPDDCSVAVWRFPRISRSDSKRHFKAEVERSLNIAVEQVRLTNSSAEVYEEFDSGDFSATIYPQRFNNNGIVTHGMACGMDDTEYRIPIAFRRKKSQVRKSDYPVILALTPSPMGGELGDFDRALIGHTYERCDWYGNSIETGFNADGIFAGKRSEPPTYAAALVYPVIGFRNVPDPVLYLNARFQGTLPRGLMDLHVRYLEERVGVGIKVSQTKALLSPMRFVSNDV